MIKTIYVLLAGILSAIALAGCGVGRDSTGEDLQQLAQIEIYSGNGDLINTVVDESVLRQFNSLNYTDIPSDTDSEQQGLENETEKLAVLYTIISYKEPVAVYNDGNLEKLMEMTVYEDSNIIKEQIALENIKEVYVPEECLTFYSTVSDEDKKFILSLAEFNKNSF